MTITSAPPSLTQREAEILTLKAKGYEWKQIIDECRISRRTLQSHFVSIHIKLGALNTTHAVAIAKDRGII